MARSTARLRPQEPESQKTLENRAHDALVTWLTEEHPQPGQTVPIREFSRMLGMSRTPVRSAVGRLHERGLLSYDSIAGFTVAVPSLSSLYELFELRLMIESHSLRRYTEQEGPTVPQFLDDLVAEATELAEGAIQDTAQYIAFRENDSRFHRTLVEMSGLPRLLALHDDLHLSIHVTRAGLEAPMNRERLDAAVDEHRKIVEALRAGDGLAAREALESHILRVRDQTIVFLSRPRPTVGGSYAR
ncbi:GntR family transcriptional regulator [Ruania alba]|uniref:DNA-binding transcriptional regulator, GntR family n=1 Tax=Ruania alba TaxID=648782 RepID=A0A1H5LFK4_9MICO|nr:GntR family transcriptional regulator [Ruania alba]SEE75161.1 DNA-binding transcriptional regulator, GntR family [Ruania alba]